MAKDPPPPPGKNVDTTSIAGEWVPEGVLLFVVQTANKMYHLRRQSLIPGAKPSTQHQANHEQIIGELQMRIVAPALYHYPYPSWHNILYHNMSYHSVIAETSVAFISASYSCGFAW